MAPINPEKLYSLREAREWLGCGNTTVWKLINSGQLETRRLGRVVRVQGAAIAACIAAMPRHYSKAAA